MKKQKYIVKSENAGGGRMSEKLLPCPFCGCKAILCSTGNHFTVEKFFVSCVVCGVETPRIARTRKEAVAAWNRRADARQLALKTRVCPMCEDCPDGCPVETPNDSRNIVTNADKIRSMSDGELAEFLETVKCQGAAAEAYDVFWEDDSYSIDWLQQPAETEE